MLDSGGTGRSEDHVDEEVPVPVPSALSDIDLVVMRAGQDGGSSFGDTNNVRR